MADPRVVPESGTVDPSREFWIVQDTEPKDEEVFLFETDPGLSGDQAWELYLDHMVASGRMEREVAGYYRDTDECYYLRVYGPYGASSATGNPEALRRRLTA